MAAALQAVDSDEDIFEDAGSFFSRSPSSSVRGQSFFPTSSSSTSSISSSSSSHTTLDTKFYPTTKKQSRRQARHRSRDYHFLELPEVPPKATFLHQSKDLKRKSNTNRSEATVMDISQLPTNMHSPGLDDEEDWTSFIARGYQDFPLPPDHRTLESTNQRNRRSLLRDHAQFPALPPLLPKRKSRSRPTSKASLRLAEACSSFLEPASPHASGLRIYDNKSKILDNKSKIDQRPTTEKTGIDWLDEELAWVSSDDEREGLDTAKTPPEHPVETFAFSPSLSKKTKRRSGLRAPLSYTKKSDDSAQPPQCDAGAPEEKSGSAHLQSKSSVSARTRPQSSTVLSQRKSHLQRLSYLENAISRFAEESHGGAQPASSEPKDQQQLEEDAARIAHCLSLLEMSDGATGPLTDGSSHSQSASASAGAGARNSRMSFMSQENEDAFRAFAARHSVSSAASSNISSMLSRHFSLAESTSTRPSTLYAPSDCGASDLSCGSPRKLPEMLPASATSVLDHEGEARAPSTTGSIASSILSQSGPQSHPSEVSYCSTRTSRKGRSAKRGARLARSQTPSIPPVAPARGASLELGRLSAQGHRSKPRNSNFSWDMEGLSESHKERPFLGAWLTEDPNETGMPAHRRSVHELGDQEIRRMAKRATAIAFSLPGEDAAGVPNAEGCQATASGKSCLSSLSSSSSSPSWPRQRTSISKNRMPALHEQKAYSHVNNVVPNNNGSTSSVATIKGTASPSLSNSSTSARCNTTLRDRILTRKGGADTFPQIESHTAQVNLGSPLQSDYATSDRVAQPPTKTDGQSQEIPPRGKLWRLKSASRSFRKRRESHSQREALLPPSPSAEEASKGQSGWNKFASLRQASFSSEALSSQYGRSQPSQTQSADRRNERQYQGWVHPLDASKTASMQFEQQRPSLQVNRHLQIARRLGSREAYGSGDARCTRLYHGTAEENIRRFLGDGKDVDSIAHSEASDRMQENTAGAASQISSDKKVRRTASLHLLC